MVWILGIPVWKGLFLGDTRFESQQLTISWISPKTLDPVTFCLGSLRLFVQRKWGTPTFTSCKWRIYENILLMLYQAMVPTSDQLSQTSGDHPTTWEPAPTKNTSYFPLYWLLNRDPFDGIFKSPTELGSIIPWKPSTTSFFYHGPRVFLHQQSCWTFLASISSSEALAFFLKKWVFEWMSFGTVVEPRGNLFVPSL